MPEGLAELVDRFSLLEAEIASGGGQAAIERQHAKGRLTARERIERLIDPDTALSEIGLWAAWEMYAEWGGAPAAGVVCGIGTVTGENR
jgi:3-methylcrotonyl-CoA carboxylase beta subunit